MSEDYHEIVQGNVRVSMENIGEGECDDYDPKDPHDTNYLRFYVSTFIDNEWIDVDDASYCTLVRADSSEEHVMDILNSLMRYIYDWVVDGVSIKKFCEGFSWVD